MKKRNACTDGAVPSVAGSCAVDAYLARLEPHRETLASALRELILESVPGVEEAIKYRIPFYSHFGRLCYINPASDHVVLGFCRGAELSAGEGLLTGDGVEVRHVLIRSLADVRDPRLHELLQEAVILNEMAAERRKGSRGAGRGQKS